MKKIADQLPAWIRRSASLAHWEQDRQQIQASVPDKDELLQAHPLRYYLSACCPQLFEQYAVVFHPFWINRKVKDLIESGLVIRDGQTDDADFSPISWQAFFAQYGQPFDLNTAHQTMWALRAQIGEPGWPPYLWAPAEGDCEHRDLSLIFGQITALYGEVTANFYYQFYKVEDWSDNLLFSGAFSELEQLQEAYRLAGSPTAIYPDSGAWCIISDYDLPYTFVGGTAGLIKGITGRKDHEIFEILPIGKEGTDSTCPT